MRTSTFLTILAFINQLVSAVEEQNIEDEVKGIVEKKVGKDVQEIFENKVGGDLNGIVENEVVENITGIVEMKVGEDVGGIVENNVGEDVKGIVGNKVGNVNGIVVKKVVQQVTGIVERKVGEDVNGIVENKVVEDVKGIVEEEVEEGVIRIVQKKLPKLLLSAFEEEYSDNYPNEITENGIITPLVPQDEQKKVGKGAEAIAQKRLALYKKMSTCCSTTKVLVSVLNKGARSCVGKHLKNQVGWNFSGKLEDLKEIEAAFHSGCLMVECLFEASGFISEERSVDGLKLKKAFIEKVGAQSADDKPAVEAAIESCFELLKNAEKRDVCKSGSRVLINCVLRETIVNCPESSWKEKKNKCKGKRLQLKHDVIAVQKDQ